MIKEKDQTLFDLIREDNIASRRMHFAGQKYKDLSNTFFNLAEEKTYTALKPEEWVTLFTEILNACIENAYMIAYRDGYSLVKEVSTYPDEQQQLNTTSPFMDAMDRCKADYKDKYKPENMSIEEMGSALNIEEERIYFRAMRDGIYYAINGNKTE